MKQKKLCSCCKREREVFYFRLDHRYISGHKKICRSCEDKIKKRAAKLKGVLRAKEQISRVEIYKQASIKKYGLEVVEVLESLYSRIESIEALEQMPRLKSIVLNFE